MDEDQYIVQVAVSTFEEGHQLASILSCHGMEVTLIVVSGEECPPEVLEAGAQLADEAEAYLLGGGQ